ncbi:hypothetical protein OHAE_1759 [Ochrobactrum soli]|uniref:Uncharacterized protein n=1 Tax=Ochrobactrum soli TaxID=2448455 RepID=A0A2P9HP68_9HYPH|nr:hypothetical protein OHAE_1759 [[Ochrobactrum] soli]
MSAVTHICCPDCLPQKRHFGVSSLREIHVASQCAFRTFQ